MKGKICWAVSFMLLLASQAFAGWVIQESVQGPNGEKEIRTLFFQNNIIRINEADETSIFDLNDKIFYLLNPRQKVYCSGPPEALQQGAEKASSQVFEEQLKELPAEQREAYRKAMERLKRQSGQEAEPQKLEVEVKKAGATMTLAGFQAEQFQVMVNGEIVEDLWIAPAIRLQDEIDMDQSIAFFKALRGPGQQVIVEESPQYIKLTKAGYAVKSLQHDPQGTLVAEVMRAQRARIADSEFKVPSDYRKLSVEQYFIQNMQVRPDDE